MPRWLSRPRGAAGDPDHAVLANGYARNNRPVPLTTRRIRAAEKNRDAVHRATAIR